MAKYLKINSIKSLVHDYDKQISADYLAALDRIVEDIVILSCVQFNGHHKRLIPALLPTIRKTK